MALDLSDAFTIGGLDRGRMDGTVLLAMRGELFGLDATGTYSINRDGVITATNGGNAATLTMKFGAGLITVDADAYDADGTGTAPEGAVAIVSFTFGDSLETDKNQGVIELISVVANAGWRLDTRFDDPSPAPMGLQSIDGNTATFLIGAPYEPEGHTQESLTANSKLYFDILAIAKGRIVGV